MPVNPLDGIGQVTLVGNGYMFTEGPQWRPSADEFVFSDIPANTIYRWSEGTGAPTVFRSPSGNANGLAVDTTGSVLLACEHGNRRVSRGDGATPATVVDRFEGARLNSPNDLTVGQDGAIYFTDPPYGIQDAQRELSFMGVFRVTASGNITAEHRGALSERPNGIALWPFAPARLYVGDSEANHVHVFDVTTGGALANRRLFVDTAATPDGMAVDTSGNLFVATSAGVQVFSPDGTPWGVISVPMQPSNVAFGGVDSRTLLITARTAVYRVTLANPGWPRF
ncbi:MAG: SMP-30/gluconolactonase/LRE family protein [Kofleriaceae bacterium]|nr:MAG: SMP-30/gluconolactonase/LRE family protein [Kofleriaceae bacterium]MBZ0237945.1 SMP-30/gluconolactonase/LRE family protein [Kofleriaceae bacterium]